MTPARDRKDAGQRAELVEAAARVVADRGVAAATTRRIAAEAGVPLGALHYWFTTKDELLEEVVASHVNKLGAAVAAAQDSAPDRSSAFDDALKLFLAAMAMEREADTGSRLASYELITWALRTPGRGDVARRQVEAFRQIAGQASESWLTEHGADLAVSRDTFAQFIAALFDGLALAWLADPEGSRPEEVVRFVSGLLAGRG